MALISCEECGNEVSDKAAACPKCGNPLTAIVEPIAAPVKKGFNYLLWIGLPITILVVFMMIGMVSNQANGGDAASEKEKREECVKALMSNIGHSTVGYADNVAYHEQIKAKCDGLSLGGQDLGK